MVKSGFKSNNSAQNTEERLDWETRRFDWVNSDGDVYLNPTFGQTLSSGQLMSRLRGSRLSIATENAYQVMSRKPRDLQLWKGKSTDQQHEGQLILWLPASPMLFVEDPPAFNQRHAHAVELAFKQRKIQGTSRLFPVSLQRAQVGATIHSATHLCPRDWVNGEDVNRRTSHA